MLHQGEFHTGCNSTISITSHIHTAALSSVVLGVIALSQRTKHNSQPLKIRYKKLLHNFLCSHFFFYSSCLPYIYIINPTVLNILAEHMEDAVKIYHSTLRVVTLQQVIGF